MKKAWAKHKKARNPHPSYQQIGAAALVGLSFVVYNKIVAVNTEAKQWSVAANDIRNDSTAIHNVMEHSSSSSSSLTTMKPQNETLNPVCLTGPFYGQTCNKVIEVGKVLNLVEEEGQGRKVAMGKAWSKWYKSHFDPRHDVILDYDGQCNRSIEARDAFFMNGWDLSFIGNLLPRLDYREAAEEILKTWPYSDNFISVHRRNLDGTCHFFAKCPYARLTRKKERKCTQERDPKEPCSAELRLQACDLEYTDVANPSNMPVVLFTDRQVPEKDATFPVIFNTTTHLFVEMLLMANSKVHWGNPRSTVDTIVASWRQGLNMEPRQCYDPNKIHYLE